MCTCICVVGIFFSSCIPLFVYNINLYTCSAPPIPCTHLQDTLSSLSEYIRTDTASSGGGEDGESHAVEGSPSPPPAGTRESIRSIPDSEMGMDVDMADVERVETSRSEGGGQGGPHGSGTGKGQDPPSRPKLQPKHPPTAPPRLLSKEFLGDVLTANPPPAATHATRDGPPIVPPNWMDAISNDTFRPRLPSGSSTGSAALGGPSAPLGRSPQGQRQSEGGGQAFCDDDVSVLTG